ncbi:MAG: tyrosine-type recombinase/integrase [Pseudomonadota bacterium]
METLDRQRLTQLFAHKLQPNGRKQRFPDHEVTGLYLRVAPGGKKTWTIRYRKPDRTSAEMVIGQVSSMPIDTARREAKRLLSNVALGEDPLQSKQNRQQEAIARKNRTLSATVERYRASPAYKTKRASTRTGYNTSLDVHILPRIGHLPVDSIGRKEVAQLLDDLHSEKSGSVSNAARSALSVVLRFAVERELIPFNPVRDIKRRHKPKQRSRVLSDEELCQLWQAANDLKGMSETVSDMLKITMLLPARINEIAGMTWDEIDLQKGLWTIPASRMKNGKNHELPLTKAVLKILTSRLSRAQTMWVFPSSDGQTHMDGKRAGRVCGRLAARLGWDSFGPHDLRRTYATRMAELGYDKDVVKRTLAHEVNAGDAFANYDHHDYRTAKKEALETWADELNRIVSNI